LVNLTLLFSYCLRLFYFPKYWKEAKVIRLPKSSKDPKFSQNLHQIILLSTTGKLFENVILQIVQRYNEEKGLLNESQFGFRARVSRTLQYMRLTDQTLNVNNNMSTAAVFLDIDKTFDTTRHLGLLYKLSALKFSTSLIKLINSFLSQRKVKVSVEGELSTPRDIEAGVPQRSFLSPTLYSPYINDTPPPGVYLRLFADDTCTYATDRKEGYVLRKFQRGLSAIETWCERWNIKINENKTQVNYFSHRLRPPRLISH
jgi:hypothetical protein